MICSYCNTKFKIISSMNHHIKTAKFCIKLRDSYILSKEPTKDKIIIENNNDQTEKKFKCIFCEKILISKQNLQTHLLICKIKEDKETQNLKDELTKYKEESQNLNNEIKKNKEDIQKLKDELQYKKLIIEKLEFIDIKNQEHIKKQDIMYKDQYETNKDLQEKIQKLAMRTTNSVVNRLELNNFITQENINDKIQKKFNDNYIPNGMKDVVKFVHEWILKSDDGNLIYACYDRARLVFKYKDSFGNEIKDPKASQLGKMLKPGLIKKLSELLKYFSEEFEHLNCRKDLSLVVDQKEYETIKFLKEKALELGFELTSMNDNNTFCNELANITS